MPDAPAAAPTRITEDPRFARVPCVRQAMILVLPGNPSPRVTVTEVANGGRLILEVAGIEHSVNLNVRELRELAQHCNRIARRAATRPEWKP